MRLRTVKTEKKNETRPLVTVTVFVQMIEKIRITKKIINS